MKRYFFTILFLLVLFLPFALAHYYGATNERASGGGEELVIVTAHVEGIRREFADAFSRWHEQNFGRPVHLVYLNYGGSNEILEYFRNAEQTIFKEQKTFKIDIVWGGGDSLYRSQLRPFLQPCTLSAATMQFAFPKPSLNGIDLYDTQRGTWYGTALSSFGIAYNKDVCRYLNVPEPKTWSDLTASQWMNWLVMADPSRSGSSAMAFMIIVERAMLDAKEQGRSEDDGWAEGMGRIRLLAANAKLFTNSSAEVPAIIAGGDAGAGMAIDFYGRSEVEAVGSARMGYLEPAGATAINSDPIGLVRGAEHRELAVRFIEFVLSERGQKLWNIRAGSPGGPLHTSLRRLPVASRVYADMSQFTDPVNPFTGNLAFDTSDQRRRTLPILGDLIRISCIDLLDELRQTRAAIRDAKRDDLEKQLGTFPYDQAEALRRAVQWASAAPLKRLELERQWKMEFKNEYRRLREQAGGH